MGFLSMSLAVFAVPPPTATIIPAPREMRVMGGEYWAKKPPKMEKVDGIPPEGYELSIRPDGMTIHYSDDAGAYYAKMTLFHMASRSRRSSGRIQTRPSATSRSSPPAPPSTVVVSSERTSTAPR